MDTFELRDTILKFQPYKIFRENSCTFLFDGGNVALYKIDNQTENILRQEGHVASYINNSSNEESDSEDYYWETLYKMKENGFLKVAEEVTKSQDIPQLQGITLMLIQSCNLACDYCFGSEGEYADRGRMKEKIATDAIDYLIENSGNNKNLAITFFGGEPLLCFELIQKVVHYCKTKECVSDKKFSYNMTTNGTLLTDKINQFIIDNKISVMISIDGDKKQQNAKRHYKSGKGCYDEVIEKTTDLRKRRFLSARATITESNIEMKEVFQHLESLGFNSIPMAPANNLLSNEDHDKYLIELKSLANYFERLIENNEIEKAKKLRILWKALKRVHKGSGQSIACGAGVNGVAIDIHGNLYPCHRFVANKEYILGSIYKKEDKRKEYINEVRLEQHKQCKNCWLRLLCSGGCPNENYVATGSTQEVFTRECSAIKELYSNIIKIYISLSDDKKNLIFNEEVQRS
ncbi:MAG: SPASM domain-containing protein [Candidatus Galacturonibacter soehngenii]|nr:SPASM domain-containing protein [Candidatus Galacturonibacter soehngenii]